MKILMKVRVMKLIKNYLILLALVSLAACSDDFLDQQPTSSVPEESMFESYAKADAALIGAYDQLSNYSFEGMWVPLMSDIMGEDIMINSVNNWNWFVPVYQLNVLPNYTYITSPWRAGYKVIYDANKIISNAQYVADASAEDKNRLEGEAKVMRAFVMLRLAQMYGTSYSKDKEALSIMNVNESVNADSPDFPRESQRVIYDQIIADLQSASQLLGYETDKGFFDKRSAQALLARAYLDMQEWTSARDMARAAYADLTLMSIEELLDGFYSRNSETIFTVAYTQEDNNVYMSIPSFYWPVGGYSSIRANDEFVALFDEYDARNFLFTKASEIDSERQLVIKFQHNKFVGNAERISIRAAEMYLIEAECEAELGNYSAAQEALYVIQKRSQPGKIKSGNTGQELIDEILLERRKELFGEGFRWNDIKRRQLAYKRSGDHWVTFDFGPGSDEYYRLTFPIPQSEIDANTMISESHQNAGY